MIHFSSKVIRMHLFNIVILGLDYEQDTTKVLHSVSAFIGLAIPSLVILTQGSSLLTARDVYNRHVRR